VAVACDLAATAASLLFESWFCVKACSCIASLVASDGAGAYISELVSSRSATERVGSMLHVFALGAVGGVVCGAVKHLCFKGSDKNAAAAAAAVVVDGSSIADTVLQPRHRCSSLLRDSKALALAASTVCACAAAAGFLVVRQQRKSRRRKGSKADR
jgi:hypothetical protein